MEIAFGHSAERYQNPRSALAWLLQLLIMLPACAYARSVEYGGGDEITVYVTPGEPTQVTFPGAVEGGFIRKQTALTVSRQKRFIVLFSRPELSIEGEALLIYTKDERSYAIRALPADDEHPRDIFVDIIDHRELPLTAEHAAPYPADRGFPPVTLAPGLMREMVLRAEFGKQGAVPGHRNSNRYSGELLLSDGALKVTINEMLLGPGLRGYILDVENTLDNAQRINPAAFRLDGTIAVGAERWELAARP